MLRRSREEQDILPQTQVGCSAQYSVPVQVTLMGADSRQGAVNEGRDLPWIYLSQLGRRGTLDQNVRELVAHTCYVNESVTVFPPSYSEKTL